MARPSGAFPRLTASHKLMGSEGQVPQPCPYSPSLLSVQGVPGAHPCPGAPEESKGRQLHFVLRRTHLRGFVLHQATKAATSFPRQ